MGNFAIRRIVLIEILTPIGFSRLQIVTVWIFVAEIVNLLIFAKMFSNYATFILKNFPKCLDFVDPLIFAHSSVYFSSAANGCREYFEANSICTQILNN